MMMRYSSGHPPPAPAPQNQGQPPSSVSTILVRHLPEAIPQDTLFRLFSHYGACAVRPCSAGRLRNCAFVDFQTEALAAQAHSQLNRLRFLGKVLKVERVNPSHNDNHNRQEEAPHLKDSNSLPASLTKDASSAANLSKGVNSAGEPIAPRLGVDYPFPSHLEYAYPPPDGNILTNIVNALIAVPRFYTQVLHLMNKMNIPAPFRMALPTPPLPASAPTPPPLPPTVVAKPPLSDLSSDESELESSEGEDDDKEKISFVGASKKMKHGRKRPRQEAIVGPAIDKDVAHEAVGLKPTSLIPKEIPMIKKKNPVLQIKFAAKQKNSENKDAANNTEESADPDEQELDSKPFATTKDLEDGKLPPEEILSLPMFKNYTAGNPATVLYIKNLAKDVVVDDFYFIFGSLFGDVETAKSGLSIKLMQEGRMKGQAFVTFPSVDLAHSALNLVNGYVFKGKPMIIQFGRNPAGGSGN